MTDDSGNKPVTMDSSSRSMLRWTIAIGAVGIMVAIVLALLPYLVGPPEDEAVKPSRMDKPVAASDGPYSVTLTWAPPQETGSGIIGYRIFQRQESAPEFEEVTYNVNPHATEFTIVGLVPGVAYIFSLIAIDSKQRSSDRTDWTRVQTQSADGLPPRPSTPAKLTSAELTASSVRLTWEAATAAAGLQLIGYHVFGIEATGERSLGRVGELTYVVTGLAPATIYTFVIKSEDSLHNLSLPTEPIVVTTLSVGGGAPPAVPNVAPAAPANLQTTARTGSSITLAWTASRDPDGRVIAYRIYRSGSFVGQTSSTAYTDTGLQLNTTYSYTVVAVDNAATASGHSASHSTYTMPDTASPPAPSGLNSQAKTHNSVSLSWTAVTDTGGSGMAGYRVFRNGSEVGTPTGNTFTDTGLSGSTTYTYTVRARDNAGNVSGDSNSIAVTTAATPVATLQISPQSGTATTVFTLTGENWSSQPHRQVNLWVTGPGMPSERCMALPAYTDDDGLGTLVGSGMDPAKRLDNDDDGALFLGFAPCESPGAEVPLTPGTYTIQARYIGQGNGPSVQFTITG